jgi:hypothetical protein
MVGTIKGIKRKLVNIKRATIFLEQTYTVKLVVASQTRVVFYVETLKIKYKKDIVITKKFNHLGTIFSNFINVYIHSIENCLKVFQEEIGPTSMLV